MRWAKTLNTAFKPCVALRLEMSPRTAFRLNRARACDKQRQAL